ncbi:MAG: hypothetical protein UT90_C0006G0011 [Parcubacteria group bacterium GW2011_GWA1_40_21]|nr:MAG: hypothetical protein UT80_C0016G0010 [Parcubacteria group bacterium GW2011_GWC1_40_13]KKR53599.1 MAG: hypothetical protein UT90_C0006G0011 [Parcubacteria group bacterium GW2011_GWA1_40_21]
MNKINQSDAVIPTDNKAILSEIKTFLTKYVGNEITFNQFTGIMDRDNELRFYNRNSLLDQRERFFKGKEKKRGKGVSKEIKMPMNIFIDFLNFLSQKRKFDLKRFKKTMLYCIETGIVVGK